MTSEAKLLRPPRPNTNRAGQAFRAPAPSAAFTGTTCAPSGSGTSCTDSNVAIVSAPPAPDLTPSPAPTAARPAPPERGGAAQSSNRRGPSGVRLQPSSAKQVRVALREGQHRDNARS